ncbi:NADH-ubiquinone oxidoreductase chain 3, partial [Trachymyrmex septentrionalis]
IIINIILTLITLILISTILLSINFIISKKTYINQEKISPFKCGFNPSSRVRLSFSRQFFIINLIFLIFNIEIALLLSLIILSINFNPFIIIYLFIFLFILILGLY